MANENAWKCNYESLIKQKEKLSHELSRRNVDVCNKEKELGTLKQGIMKMEREVVEWDKERKRMSDEFERSTKDWQERLRFEYEAKMSEHDLLH